MKDKLLFSVVTISYNCKDEIERTIKSVIKQTYKGYEYILVDGGSSDGTMEIVNKYKSYFTKIISEEDGGIYDAMNKGLSLASGKYIVYLNSGDEFVDEKVLKKVSLSLTGKEDILYGSARIKYTSERYTINNTQLTKRNLQRGLMPCHQSMYFKVKLLKYLEGFSKNYKIAGDFDLCCRAILLNSLKTKFINEELSVFYKGGQSSNMGISYPEIYSILKESFSIWDALSFKIRRQILELTRRKLLKFFKLDKFARKTFLKIKGKNSEENAIRN